MRLRQLLGFGARGLPQARTRLVVYCPAQNSPIFVSTTEIPEGVTIEWPWDPTKSLADLPPEVGRSVVISMRAWQLHEKENSWILAGEAVIDLRNLVPTNMRANPSTEGPQWLFHGEQDMVYEPSLLHYGANDHPRVSTLSYDALNEIWALQQCTDDARAASDSLRCEIKEKIPDSLTILERRRNELNRLLQKTRKSTESIIATTAKLRTQSRQLRSGQHQRSEALILSTHAIKDVQGLTNFKASEDGELEAAVRKEQGRLARQILEIFPIESIGHTFHFSICGLTLPSVFSINHYDPVQVGAALGLVAQVVVALSVYLDVALPYPVHPYGSQSSVVDDISLIRGSRVFPLWTKGALLYRVEYALYLLHKDIEQLMTARELAVVDLKQTLANLKNLLLVVSSQS